MMRDDERVIVGVTKWGINYRIPLSIWSLRDVIRWGFSDNVDTKSFFKVLFAKVFGS